MINPIHKWGRCRFFKDMVHSSERPSGDGDASRPSRHGPRFAQVLSALLGITALLAFVLFLFTGPWQLLVLYRDTIAVLVFDIGSCAADFDVG